MLALRLTHKSGGRANGSVEKGIKVHNPLVLGSCSTPFSFLSCFGQDNDSSLLFVIIIVENQNGSLWPYHRLKLSYRERERQFESDFYRGIHVWIFQIWNHFLRQKWLFKFHIDIFLLIPVVTGQATTTTTKHNTEKQRQDWDCTDLMILDT